MKRGIAARTAMGLLILALFVIVIFLVVGDFFTVLLGWMNGAECGFSATLASAKFDKACIVEGEFPSSLSCPRTNLAFSATEILKSFKGKQEPLSLSSDIDPLSAPVVERVFMNELVACWEKFGKGQVALFPEGDKGIFDLAGGSESTVCHICAELSFPSDADLSDVSLQRALSLQTDGQTYKQALNNKRAHCQVDYRNGDTCWNNFENHLVKHGVTKMNVVDPAKNYAVVMMRHGYEWCKDTKDQGRELTMFSYILPEDELMKACDVVVT